jgi:hypothetical protein
MLLFTLKHSHTPSRLLKSFLKELYDLIFKYLLKNIIFLNFFEKYKHFLKNDIVR